LAIGNKFLAYIPCIESQNFQPPQAPVQPHVIHLESAWDKSHHDDVVVELDDVDVELDDVDVKNEDAVKELKKDVTRAEAAYNLAVQQLNEYQQKHIPEYAKTREYRWAGLGAFAGGSLGSVFHIVPHQMGAALATTVGVGVGAGAVLAALGGWAAYRAAKSTLFL
jgi:hypothetical protein